MPPYAAAGRSFPSTSAVAVHNTSSSNAALALHHGHTLLLASPPRPLPASTASCGRLRLWCRTVNLTERHQRLAVLVAAHCVNQPHVSVTTLASTRSPSWIRQIGALDLAAYALPASSFCPGLVSAPTIVATSIMMTALAPPSLQSPDFADGDAEERRARG